jgi:hypothetical protein
MPMVETAPALAAHETSCEIPLAVWTALLNSERSEQP